MVPVSLSRPPHAWTRALLPQRDKALGLLDKTKISVVRTLAKVKCREHPKTSKGHRRKEKTIGNERQHDRNSPDHQPLTRFAGIRCELVHICGAEWRLRTCPAIRDVCSWALQCEIPNTCESLKIGRLCRGEFEIRSPLPGDLTPSRSVGGNVPKPLTIRPGRGCASRSSRRAS